MDVAAITEIARFASPIPAPQAPVVHDGRLWISSMREPRIVALDPDSHAIVEERALPGVAWGVTMHDGRMVVVCGTGDDDDRVIYASARDTFTRFAACPESTGSQIASDGWNLLLAQWYNRNVLRLGIDGAVLQTYMFPRGVCGVVVRSDELFVLTVDDEASTDYVLMRCDLTTGASADVAHVPFRARGLAFDGSAFITNHREANEIVRFLSPG
jgi:hypothetical protein